MRCRISSSAASIAYVAKYLTGSPDAAARFSAYRLLPLRLAPRMNRRRNGVMFQFSTFDDGCEGPQPSSPANGVAGSTIIWRGTFCRTGYGTRTRDKAAVPKAPHMPLE